MSRLRTWAILGRISNLPTVFVNVLVGCLFVSGQGLYSTWPPIIQTMFAGCAFYFFGMVQNDVFDVEVDRKENRLRPLVTGMVSMREALFLMILSSVAGFAALATTNLATFFLGTLLFAFIYLYNIYHHRSSFALPLMALCRVMLYLMGASALAGEFFWSQELAYYLLFVFIFVLMITAIATLESKKEHNRTLVALGIVTVGLLLPLVISHMDREPSSPWVYYPAMSLWFLTIAHAALYLSLSTPLKRTVMYLIAALIMSDVVIATLLDGRILMGIHCLLLFYWTVLYQRTIPGT